MRLEDTTIEGVRLSGVRTLTCDCGTVGYLVNQIGQDKLYTSALDMLKARAGHFSRRLAHYKWDCQGRRIAEENLRLYKCLAAQVKAKGEV